MELNFGEKMMILRKKKKMSQKELADILEVSQVNITNYEQNKYRPSYETLVKIANYFNVTTDYLLQDK